MPKNFGSGTLGDLYALEHTADRVSGRALGRDPADLADHLAHPLGGHLLTVAGAGRPGDALVHESATQVVCAGLKDLLAPLQAALDPGDLDVVDQAPED